MKIRVGDLVIWRYGLLRTSFYGSIVSKGSFYKDKVVFKPDSIIELRNSVAIHSIPDCFEVWSNSIQVDYNRIFIETYLK